MPKGVGYPPKGMKGKKKKGKRGCFALALGLLLMMAAVLVGGAEAVQFRGGQESVATNATNDMGNNANRAVLHIRNQDGSNPIYCSGASDVASTTGFRVAAGENLVIDYKVNGRWAASNKLYCISTGGTVTASFIEVTSE